MLDDFTVVGYGEWESRKALESHLQKGADSQHFAAVASCVLLLRLVHSLVRGTVGGLTAGTSAHRSNKPHLMLIMHFCYADYFQEFKQGILEHNIVAIKSPLK
jgi:hypothetical protein